MTVLFVQSDLVCVLYFKKQLPNRLGKMLAPLHWHDYKKNYGRLDDFVASHPEVSFTFKLEV